MTSMYPNLDASILIQLIRQNIDDFREFGRVSFQMQPFETNVEGVKDYLKLKTSL